MSASELRLSAAHLLYALSLSATATALFGAWGLPVAGFVALVWWQLLSGAQREARLWARETAAAKAMDSKVTRTGKFKLEVVVGLVISALILGLFLPATEESDPMRHAEFSMQVVAHAISDYEREHGSALPDIVYDAEGKPMHSWRALILRQLGEGQLAAAYRLDEPWDSPNNLTLAKARPWHYQIYHGRPAAQPTETSLHLISVGAQRMVIEHEQAIGNWLEPRKLAWENWGSKNRTPDLEQGFWRRGFFMSKYRGRLAVSKTETLQIHPHADLANIDFSAPDVSSESGWNRQEIGTPVKRYHVDHALQLGCFLLVVLYPIRWLKRIQSIAPDPIGKVGRDGIK